MEGERNGHDPPSVVEPIHDQSRELASKEGVSINQLINSAVAVKGEHRGRATRPSWGYSPSMALPWLQLTMCSTQARSKAKRFPRG